MWCRRSSPVCTRRFTSRWPEPYRWLWHTMHTSPVSCSSSASRSDSASVIPMGISMSTCLPIDMQSSACAAWIALGVVRMQASTPGCRRHSSRSSDQCGIPLSAAKASASSARPPARLTTSTSSIVDRVS